MSLKKDVVKHLADFEKNISQTEREICDKAEELKQRIDRDKQKLLDELTAVKNRRVKEIVNFEERIDLHLKITLTNSEYSQMLAANGTNEEITRGTAGLIAQCGEMVNSELVKYGIGLLGIGVVSFLPGKRSEENVVGIISVNNFKGVYLVAGTFLCYVNWFISS